MDKIKMHIPTNQYGFIEVEREFALENKEKLYKEAVDDFKLISHLWNNPDKEEALKLGQTKKDKWGNIYEVGQRGDGKLLWIATGKKGD